MDGFSGYSQIAIFEGDQVKTAFIMPWGTFIYKKMAFGLKNVSASFNCIVYIVFDPFLNKFLKIFMDDFSNFLGAGCAALVESL